MLWHKKIWSSTVDQKLGVYKKLAGAGETNGIFSVSGFGRAAT